MSIENKDEFVSFLQGRGSYSMNPNELWELKELDTFEKVILAYIISKKPGWQSSRNNLSKNLNITKEKVSSAIKNLESLNMLQVLTGQNKSWSFSLITPDKWSVRTSTPGSSHQPILGGRTAHTKDNTIKEKTSFSQEGSVLRTSRGAEGDRRRTKNAHLPGKNEIQENSSFISPEAEIIYKDLVARGVTPADLNGMSLCEYSNQRAYAGGFKQIDTAELVKQWQMQQGNLDVDEMMAAAGVDDDGS